MNGLTGIHHLSLTVTDLRESVGWYQEVLGFVLVEELEKVGFQRRRLRHPGAGIVLTLTRHDATQGESFDERRTGLDHLGFGVPDVAAVHAWKQRLEEHGVEHSPVKPNGPGAIITLRDPDGIQLEIVAVAP